MRRSRKPARRGNANEPDECLHALWQGAVLAGMVWVLMRLRGGWSAESRYWLWSATLVVIAALPLLALMPRVELATPVSFPTVATSVAAANVTKLVESVPSMRSSVLLSTAQQVWQLLPALWFAIVCWRLLLLAKAAHTLRRWRNNAQRVPVEALPLPPRCVQGMRRSRKHGRHDARGRWDSESLHSASAGAASTAPSPAACARVAA